MKAVTAVIIALALACSYTQADAKVRKTHKYYSSKPVRTFAFTGGHQMGYEADPFLYKNGPYGNYPYFDARNFWERVQSGPLSDTTSPSAF